MPQISGMVVEKWTRRPVRGVIVRIGHYVGLTDAMGRFSIDAPIGSHQISITHRDFHPYAMPLNVVSVVNLGVISLDSKVVAL